MLSGLNFFFREAWFLGVILLVPVSAVREELSDMVVWVEVQVAVRIITKLIWRPLPNFGCGAVLAWWCWRGRTMAIWWRHPHIPRQTDSQSGSSHHMPAWTNS
jgi:hypothetical protein